MTAQPMPRHLLYADALISLWRDRDKQRGGQRLSRRDADALLNARREEARRLPREEREVALDELGRWRAPRARA